MQDPWKITAEERSKHDSQFFSIKPVGGFVNGDQAKGFFLQSGLAAPVLMHIWSLADMNADGKMDKKEFSIACHLISAKLKGLELPKSLPTSLKADPVPSLGSFGAPPMPSSGAIVMGTMPAMTSQPMMGMGVMPAVVPMIGAPPVQVTPTKVSPVMSSAVTGEWAVSHAQKLKYTQQFNAHDPQRKGFLSGVEAKSMLQQTLLMHSVLAQIWGLADIDNDGKLTNEEFCLAMHLVDMAKSGQTLPQKLPPNLIPPSYRRGPLPGGVVGLPPGGLNQPGLIPPTSPAPAMAPTQPMPAKQDAFGDLLGGVVMPGIPTIAPQTLEQEAEIFRMPETFEDKRKENFDKGQAELEKRRAMLQEQLKQQEEERLAHERAEQEKRERIRQDQERKRHMELEKQLEKQRAVEHEREEQRRKAMEQREAARKELERQRQVEWERQRRDQLMMEKQREKAQVDQLRIECSDLNRELETLDTRKVEIKHRIEQTHGTVTDFTSNIEKMRVTRDNKVTDIKRFELQIQDLQQRLNMLTQQKHQFDVQVQAQNHTVDDTYKSVMHSYNNKKTLIERHEGTLKELELSTASRLEEIDTLNTECKQFSNTIYSLESVNTKMGANLRQKQTDYGESKQKKVKPARPPAITPTPMSEPAKEKSVAFGWLDNTFGNESPLTVPSATSQDSWANAFGGMSSVTKSKSPSLNADPPTADSVAWGNAGLALTSAFSSLKETTEPVPTGDGLANNEDPWAKFDAHKTSVFDSQNDQSSSTWATSFFSDSKGATPVMISGPPLAAKTTKAEGVVYKKHRATFPFDARHQDELSLTVDDIIWVKPNEPGAEPGWVLGVNNDGTDEGWFPLAYADELPDDGSVPSFGKSSQPSVFTFPDATTTASDDNVYTNLPAEVEVIPAETPVSLPADIPATPIDDDNIYENINDIADPVSNNLPQSDQSSFTAVATSGSPTPGQGQAAPEGLRVQAMIMWRAKRDNHLSFDKGDIITVNEQQDNWWSGELNGKVGWFPKSFVKVIGDSVTGKPEEIQALGNGSAATPTPVIREPSSIVETRVPDPMSPPATINTPEHYISIYAYSSSEPGDLNFLQNETITVIKNDSDWWTGMIGDRKGIFPANYVKKSETQPQPQPQPQPQSPPPVQSPPQSQGAPKSTKSREIATVLAPYQATGNEQLSLQTGQLINVRKKNPSGWWEGELQARGQKRQVGWFPANYVQLLSSGSRGTPSENRKSLSPTPHTTDGGSRSATPVSYPQPTATPSLEQVVATFTYQAQHADEMSFDKTSVINVLNKDDPDWWKGELNGAEGMFPANYVTPLSQGVGGTNGTASPAPTSSVSSGNENKRQSAIYELIQTEEAYMADLKLVYDVFYKPMLAEKALTPAEMQTIFVNWRELMMSNKKLLMALKVRRKTCRGQNISYIGDVLCENFPHMTSYIRFCSCQLNATTLLHEKIDNDPKFREFHKNCAQDARVMGMPMSTYYLKPLQRITRYPMIIEKILRHTSPEHVDHATLSEAHSKASELCSQVNEGVREKENSDKLEWIQQHVICDGLAEKITFNSVTNCLGPRKYLYSGTLYKNKSGKELTGFLFSDFLLLAQPERAIGQMADVFSFDVKANVQFKMYRNPIFLNEVLLKKPPNADTDPTLFTVQHTEKDYGLKAITSPERDTWYKKMDEAAKFYRETERKRKEKAHSAKGVSTRGCGRLLVIVLEGCNLIASDANGKSDPYCEVNMGVQEHKTKVINNTLNPKWNHSMQFTIKNLVEDVLCITVYDRDLFSPNDFLGRTEIRIKDIIVESKEKKGPLTKRLKLYEVESGEVNVKLDLQIFDSTL